jgi:hypothetical protein
MDMCREVTQANCAAVLNEHYVPVPYNITAHPDKDKIGISWSGRMNGTMAGFNIYRSNSLDTGFVIINPSVFSDTVFQDLTASPGVNYFYRITSVNKDNFESTGSNSVSCFRMSLDRELLVIKDAKGNTDDPADSLVIDYYKRIFRDFTYDFIDASTISNAMVNAYPVAFWRLIYNQNKFNK